MAKKFVDLIGDKNFPSKVNVKGVDSNATGVSSGAIAFLRFLLDKRIPEGEELTVLSTEYTAQYFLEPEGRSLYLWQDRIELLEIKALTSQGFTKDSVINNALKEFHLADSFEVYLNEKIHSVFIRQKMDGREYSFGLVFCLIPVMLKWWFWDFAKDATPEELSLLKLLSERKLGEFQCELERYLPKVFSYTREQLYRDQLSGISSAINAGRMKEIEMKLEQIRNRQAKIMAEYSELMEQSREQNIMLNGLKFGDTTDADEDLINLFCNTESLQLDCVLNGEIYFTVHSHMTSWDADAAEAYIANRTSALFSILSPVAYQEFRDNNENRAILWSAIFGNNPTIKLKMSGSFKYVIGETLRGLRVQDFTDSIANMHVALFDCKGDYGPWIAEAISRGDTVGVIQSAMMWGTSVNMLESATFEPLIHKILESKQKILELPDGTSVTTKEALEYLENN